MLDEMIFNAFLNKISALYAVEEATHTVVRASKLLIDELGFDPTGKKCYDAFCGKTAVCEYCPALPAIEDKPYTWEYYDEGRQRSYQIVNGLIPGGDGKTYRVGQIMDIQESMVLSKYALGYLSLLKDLTDMQSEMVSSHVDAFEAALPFIAKQFSALAVTMVLAGQYGNMVYTCSGNGKKAVAKKIPDTTSRVDRLMGTGSYRHLRSEDMTEEETELFRPLVPETESYGVSLHSRCISGGKFTLAILCAGTEPPMDDQLITVNVLCTHTENYILHEQILWDNSHDKMTSLFSRSEYFKRAADSYKSASSIGILFLDVDGLKETNDRYGHSEGDKLILKVSRAMLSLAQFGCDAFRMGGDEFVIVSLEKNCELIGAMCDQLQEAIDAQNRACPRPHLRVSMGTAWADGIFDVYALYRQADAQMYAAKKAAKEKDSIQPRDKP